MGRRCATVPSLSVASRSSSFGYSPGVVTVAASGWSSFNGSPPSLATPCAATEMPGERDGQVSGITGAWEKPPAFTLRVGRALALLDGAGGEAGHVVIEEEHVEDHDGHRAQHGPRHERAPEVDVAAYELGGDAHAGGDLLRGGGEGQRVDELVPGQREGEQRRAHEPGHRDGQHDAP